MILRALFRHGVLLLLLLSGTVVAGDTAQDATSGLVARLKVVFPDIEVTRISPAPILGLYEVLVGTDVLYVSADGRYLIQGDMLDLGQRRNLTENQRALLRIQRLSAEPLADMIEFAPPSPRHVVYVFTDVQCGYCRRLHREMAEINKRGIAVRYLAYPRAGIGSTAFVEMESIWCSADRRKALTEAKVGKIPAQKSCANPVGRQFALGEALGVRGTPAIFTTEGRALPGYMPPDELLQTLQQKRE